VLPRALNLPLLVWELQGGQVRAALRLAHEFQDQPPVLAVASDAPIRVVVADEAREFNPEHRRELEVENHLVVVVEAIAHETFLHL